MLAKNGREAGDRVSVLLAVLFAASVSLFAQTSPPEISKETEARLRRQIENGSIEEKRSALFEIRNLRSPLASAIAVGALNDRDEVVRATAASSVVFMSKPEAARELVPLLNDKGEFARREAAHALGEVGDHSATAPLIRLLQNEKVHEVRTAVAMALGKIGDPAAVESLAGLLRNQPREEDEFLRRSSARAIGQIAQIIQTGDRGVVTPQNFLPEKFKQNGPSNSATSPDRFQSAVDVLMAVLRNTAETDDTRREAAFALGAIGDPQAVATLQAFVSAPDPYLAEICREALLKIGRRGG